MGLNVVQPTKFVMRISKCGTDTFSGGYKQIENKDALDLALQVCYIMTKDFVYDKELTPKFRYHLGCLLLNSVEGYDDKEVLEDIKNAKKFLDKWKLREIEKQEK